MTRAAVSIPSNIAEGYERGTNKDFIRFLNIAQGSAAELRTQAYIANSVELIDQDAMRHIVEECKGIGAMLQALAKARSNNVYSRPPRRRKSRILTWIFRNPETVAFKTLLHSESVQPMNAFPTKSSKNRHMGPTPMGGSVSKGPGRARKLVAWSLRRLSSKRLND